MNKRVAARLAMAALCCGQSMAQSATPLSEYRAVQGYGKPGDPWCELIGFVRSTSAAKVQFDLIEGTLGRKL